ncbi:MAG: hypothetical protein AAB733_00470 [Patescibacteria group bacterium]
MPSVKWAFVPHFTSALPQPPSRECLLPLWPKHSHAMGDNASNYNKPRHDVKLRQSLDKPPVIRYDRY